MPLPPSTWIANLPVTAGQLNQDMYTYDGTYFASNGVMFHANRPTCHEAYVKATGVHSSPAGNWVQYGGIAGEAVSIVDTSALFGGGCDAPAGGAKYESSGVTAIGSDGVPGVRGGWVLMMNSTGVNTFSGNPSALGTGWFLGGAVNQDVGTIQVGSTVHDNCGIAINLLHVTAAATSAASFYQPGVLASDPASKFLTVAANTANTWGETPRFTQIWCGVGQGGSTVASIPTPQTAFTSVLPITHTLLNNTIQQTLTLLNNPPMLCVAQALSTAIPTSTVTIVPFNTTPNIDNYNGFTASTHVYTVKLPGVYFVHSSTIFAAAQSTGNCAGGITVNGTNYWGGNYTCTASAQVNNGCATTRVMDLSAGDTISAYAWQTSGSASSLGASHMCHLVIVWMGVLAPSSNPGMPWTPPDVHGELFHAGYPPGTASTQLVPLFNAKISNDLNFLLNKPYFMGYQTVAQTGLSANTFHTVTTNVVGGMIHGSGTYDGDNYNGWNSVTNAYVAQVAGWYLVTGEFSMTPNASTAGSILAGISNPVSGGIANGATATTDWYQHMISATSGGPSAPLACSLYYLLPGEQVAPMVQWQPNSGSGTSSTDVTSFNSTFSVIWICE